MITTSFVFTSLRNGAPDGPRRGRGQVVHQEKTQERTKVAVTRASARAVRSMSTLLAEQRAFIEGDIILHAAVADDEGVPFIAIGAGCRVATRPPRVTVLVARAQTQEFLAVLAATRRIAVEFGRAPHHESLQIKGEDCAIEEAGAEDLRLAAAYRDKLVRQLGLLGLGPAETEIYLGLPYAGLVALCFTPTAIFQQKPGPQAGQPLV
ncbi:MAG TPA: hypothetical protein PJ986_10290 [Gammaproteobacteria bacterium]|nr:hypothetical protein [Gammaproteobacteria bacterium]